MASFIVASAIDKMMKMIQFVISCQQDERGWGKGGAKGEEIVSEHTNLTYALRTYLMNNYPHIHHTTTRNVQVRTCTRGPTRLLPQSTVYI
jgi:hypothetical protein